MSPPSIRPPKRDTRGPLRIDTDSLVKNPDGLRQLCSPAQNAPACRSW